MKSIKCLLLIISMMLMSDAAAQVETYYEPELLMVSQPKMEFYDSSESDYVQFYFDVKNIGSETYKGEFIILMEPDVDHFYAKKNIKVKAGAVKRIRMELDLGMIYYDSVYTVLPVYEFENQWYPLTAYEQFSSLMLCLDSPSYSSDLVVTAEPAPVFDYYYDVRLQRPPVYGYYYVTPPPGWAYAYGYNPYCVNNYYTVINGNVSNGGGNIQVGNVGERPSAPRVSHNHYSTRISNTSSSSRRTHSGSGNSVTPSVPRRTSSGTSSSARTSSSSSNRRSSSVSNPSNSRNNSSSTSSSSRRSSNSSSTISNSSSSRSSSSRSSSSRSSSSSSSRSSSSTSSSRSGGGRR